MVSEKIEGESRQEGEICLRVMQRAASQSDAGCITFHPVAINFCRLLNPGALIIKLLGCRSQAHTSQFLEIYCLPCICCRTGVINGRQLTVLNLLINYKQFLHVCVSALRVSPRQVNTWCWCMCFAYVCVRWRLNWIINCIPYCALRPACIINRGRQ